MVIHSNKGFELGPADVFFIRFFHCLHFSKLDSYYITPPPQQFTASIVTSNGPNSENGYGTSTNNVSRYTLYRTLSQNSGIIVYG